MKVEKGLTVKRLVEILRAFPQDVPVEMEIEMEERGPFTFMFRQITNVEQAERHGIEKVFIVHQIDWE